MKMRSKRLAVLGLVVVLAMGGCVQVPAVGPAATVAPAPAGAVRGLGDTNLTNVWAAHLGVSGPAAAATATPAVYVDNLGSTNDGLVVAKAATPVFKVGNAGVVTGYVLRYASSGKAIVCGTTTITGTAVLATGLATPSYVTLGLGADANYDHNRLSFTNASATVTAKVWNGAATPAAATTGVPVDWCAIGTP